MKKILKVDNPNVYAQYVGAPVLHPQLALISYDEVSPFPNSLNNYGVYAFSFSSNSLSTFPTAPNPSLSETVPS